MPWPFVIEWGVLLAFVACLGVHVVWQHCTNLAQRRQYELELPRRAFNGSVISPQILRLRQDYAAATHSRSHATYRREREVAAARQAVTELAYFRRSSGDDSTSGATPPARDST